MKKKKIYIIAVFIYILTIGTSTIAFAATDDPLQVINNLSDYIFNILKVVPKNSIIQNIIIIFK